MAITLSDAQRAVANKIATVARNLGIDPRLAVADAYQESKLNPQAVGDNGTSFGVFQLHKGGELGSLTPTQAFDVDTNSVTALSVFKKNQGTYSGGTLAAKSQRPADPIGYAASVDSLVASGSFDEFANGSTSSIPSGSITTQDSSDSVKLFSLGPIGDVSLPKSGLVRFVVIAVGFSFVVVGLHALTTNAQTPVGVISDGSSGAVSHVKKLHRSSSKGKTDSGKTISSATEVG